MIERQVQHHIPAVLLLWRAATMTLQSTAVATSTAAATTARRATDGKAFSISAAAVKRRANKQSVQPDAPLARASRGRMPLPSPREAQNAAFIQEGASQRRALSHWSALRSRLFPALRGAVLPFTAVCLAAAAGAQKGHLQQQPDALGLHGSRLPPRAPFATHGSGFPEPAAPSDVRTARQMLESAGFAHPGMQPGAAWGAMPADGTNSSGEVPAIFEYLLLFPA
ncbi:hypothetical protein PLESTB_000559500 [Pleodorina starrii]|uniref:Uncharacterized protein n=1 Tax=Pleodorina starrii TaxID=330485 RepID=A0A9W6BGT9_9CHLO|nr:hypothetical protein PLESTM_000284700 [Pleodorina starrii]GLC51887.1 hypothetical protein PLESTB_000559500 [Pleodorina starrii]GLC74568.1 hypothetical protein PLESTF_001528300 [Pleodorina starrii]